MRHRLVILAALIAVTVFFAAPREEARADGPPTISSFSPTSSPSTGGTFLTIYGSGFVPGSTTYVTVGGSLATGVTVVNAYQLTAVTPAGVTGSTNTQVVVINPDGQTATTTGFSFTGGQTTNTGSVSVASINPSSGATGQLVTITGYGFDQNTNVFFGGVAAPSVVWMSANWLMTYAPAGISGSVQVQVVSSQGASGLSPTNFTSTASSGTSTGTHSITSVSPTSISAGATFLIYGSGFLNGATVSVGGYPATSVTFSSSGLLTATAPAGPSGLATVAVTNPGGTIATYNGLTYGSTTTTGGQPSVTSVSPSTGSSAGGTVVSINGSGFVAPVNVTFGGVPATSVNVVSNFLITATTPPNPVGTVSVLVSGGAGSVGGLTSGFTYELAWPRVTSISPSTGALIGGTTLTLTGTGFAPGATVTVGGQPAATVSAVSPTQIIVTTPPGPAGNATVLVTNPGGAISGLASGFAYSANPQPQVPVVTGASVTSVSPSSGPSSGNTAISISGTGFMPGATVTVGGVSIGSTVVSSTLITATTPAVTGTGSVTVTVMNPGASPVSLLNAFTYGTSTTSTGGGGSPGPGGASNPVPAAGGLFVFGGGTNAQLVAASGCNASTAVFWATDSKGAWIGYIPSVPVAVVNAAWLALFASGIPAGTAIYARC